jgi:hypothetical protein
MMVTVSLDSPSCEVTLFEPVSVVYRDATRQAKGLYRLKYVGALWSGLAYLSRYNSGWFCHRGRGRGTLGSYPSRRWSGGGSTMAAARCSAPAAGGRGQSRAARARGRRRDWRGPGGLFGNLRNVRDFSVN